MDLFWLIFTIWIVGVVIGWIIVGRLRDKFVFYEDFLVVSSAIVGWPIILIVIFPLFGTWYVCIKLGEWLGEKMK